MELNDDQNFLEKTEDTQKVTEHRPNNIENQVSQTQAMPSKKKSLLFKSLMLILIIVGATPVIFVLYIFITLSTYSNHHSSESKALKKETIGLFQKSNLSVSDYDCHDVELHNECYFNISDSSFKVAEFLESQGFKENLTYGKGFKKDKFYVINLEDNNRYNSYYMED
jgi:hypothetical protein